MTTKQNFYNYLKSYKSKQCKKDEACGAISKMKKAELQKLAYKYGYSLTNRVYKGKKTEAKQSTPTPVASPEPAVKSSIETLENKIKKIKKEIDEDQNKIDDPNVKPSMKLLTKLKTKKMKWLKLLKELKSMKKKK
jgi:hypothetical protein